MKNEAFTYHQYEQLNWLIQEETKINSTINRFIIQHILNGKKSEEVRVFDMGFGTGLLLEMLQDALSPEYESITLEGCEPATNHFKHFESRSIQSGLAQTRIFNQTFLETCTDTKFDYLISVYVFPHINTDELADVANRIHSMLRADGKFILVVANENQLLAKLHSHPELVIEKRSTMRNGNTYQEHVHYSEIPQIGSIIDINREERYYLELFRELGMEVSFQSTLDDQGFLCSFLVFSKSAS